MRITLLKYLLTFITVAKAKLIEDLTDNPDEFGVLQRGNTCGWSNEDPGNSPHITAVNYKYKVYYVITNYRLNWIKAYAYCRSHGMFLASPSTKEEDQFLISALHSKKLVKTEKKDQYWISLNDLVKNKTFVWMSTGEEVTYTNWHKGEPNNAEGDLGYEHCGELWTMELNNTKWNDWQCLCPQNFICEN